MACINKNHPEITKMAEELNVSPAVLSAKIGIWQTKNNIIDKFPTKEELGLKEASILNKLQSNLKDNEVNQTLKAVDILSSDKATQVFEKGAKNNWDLNKILTELQVPKDQRPFIQKAYDSTVIINPETNKVLEPSINELITSLLANNTFTIEINTATSAIENIDYIGNISKFSVGNDEYFFETIEDIDEEGFESVSYKRTKNNIEISKKDFDDALKMANTRNTKYYSNLTVPGGTNYIESEIATPTITPNIKGHAQFATHNGIGWFRSDEQKITGNREITEEDQLPPDMFEIGETINDIIYGSKTRRVLELQSDLFQNIEPSKVWDEGRKNVIGYKVGNNKSLKQFDTLEEAKKYSKELKVLANKQQSNFIELLNKDSNWITFFVKSIIQDSQKKGYEKILFPTGNTASKVEGHSTLESYKKEKEDKLKELEKQKEKNVDGFIEDIDFDDDGRPEISKISVGQIDNDIAKLEKELEDIEGPGGFGALKPIYKFYETTVTNILNKNYGKNNIKLITDEYGNTWNELNIEDIRDSSTIFMKKVDFGNLIKDLNSESNQSIKEIDHSVENSRILFNGRQGKIEINDVLSNIVENYPGITEEVIDLINKARNLIGKSGVKLQFIDESVFSDSSVLMDYNTNKNVIRIARSKFKNNSPAMIVGTLLHEIAHAQTAQAILNPVTFEEKEFNKTITNAFNKYKTLTTTNSYGFENEMEFVAELYSNPEFREEIKTLSNKDNDNFYQKFIDAVRRLFGLKKNSEYDSLIKEIVEFTQQDNSNFKGLKTDIYGQFAKKVDYEKPKLATLEENFNSVITKAKDRLEQAYRRAEMASKKSKGTKDNKEHLDAITALIEEMSKYEGIDNWKSVIAYTKTLSNTVLSLKRRFDTKNFREDGLIELINNFENYLAAYDLLPEINTLISKSRGEDLTDLELADLAELRNIIHGFESSHSALLSDFARAKTVQSESILSDPQYNTQIETNNRIRLEKEYKDLSITEESRNEYVSRMMNGRDKDKIKQELLDSARNLANNPTFDISAVARVLSDNLNINSRLIEIVVNIVNTTRDKIIQTFNEKSLELGELHDEFTKVKGNKPPSKLYENQYEQDSEGNYWLKGNYKIEFREKYLNELAPIKNQIIEFVQANKAKGVMYKVYSKQKEYIDLKKQEKAWMTLNTKVDKSVALEQGWLPADKYLNPKLTGVDAKLNKEFRKISNDSAKDTDQKQSLVRRISTGPKQVMFYKFPSHSKSDLERRIELDGKGLIKDKLTDLTKIKADDIGYGKPLDSAGNEVRGVKVNFRGKMDPNEQSLDLMTMYRYEILNGLNYREKSKELVKVKMIADISRDKKYMKESLKGKFPILNIFSKNNAVAEFDGADSQEYKKIIGLIESQFYDVLSYESMTLLGKADLNKVSSTISGYTAQVAMIFNVASGTANVLNGMTQLFIESMGDRFISRSALLKAEKRYAVELPNILADLSNPSKKSFVNQVLKMFDSIGGFTPEQQSFIKDTMVKKLTSSDTLNSFNEMGEHMMSSVLTMGVLDTLKVMNKDSKYIDKDGNIVEESKAASLLDMLNMNDKGVVEMSPLVAYTNKNLNIEYHKGGKTHINLLIKKKSEDLFGVYDPNMYAELSKLWYGKAVLMFKKFFISGLQYRWKGVGTSFKEKSDLTEDDLIYNSAIKEYEEGTYTTLIRFFRRGVVPTLKNLQIQFMKDNYNSLTDYEKSNLKKVTVEFMITSVLVPMIGMMLASAASGDDDNDTLWFWVYQTRRLESELKQFYNPIETSRMISNPVAGIRTIQNGLGLIYEIMTPFNLVQEDDENFFSYLDEDSEGKNILWKKTKKNIPIMAQIDKDWKRMHNFINK